MSGIERFIQAQDDGGVYERALAEIVSGRKQGHWIWFVFPQRAGLGTSHLSRIYGLRVDEARSYLQHPVLFPRLVAITNAVAAHVRDGLSIESLMGSAIDAQKLVSSLTLFARVAHSLASEAGGGEHARFAGTADEILGAAERQGYPACRRTLAQLGD